MRILLHGMPHWCNYDLSSHYNGPHDIRTIGFDDQVQSDYYYDPANDSICEILHLIGDEWKPDLIVLWFVGGYPPPQDIEQSPVPTLATVGDWHVGFPAIAANLGRYDVVLCDKPGVDIFNKAGIKAQYLMPMFSQVSSVHKPHQVEKDIDILFVGSMNHARNFERAKYLERIARLSGKYHVVITDNAYDEQYARLLSRAKIVFNMSVRGELNLRLFETFACNSTAFLENGNLEAPQYFEDAREYVKYDSDNIEDRIDYYLAHPDDAIKISANGHARSNEFAGENTFNTIVEWAVEQPDSGRPFKKLEQEERDYRMLLMCAFKANRAYTRLGMKLANRLIEKSPEDPRLWTALGHQFINPHNPNLNLQDCLGTTQQQIERCKGAYMQARRLDTESGPYAFNAAVAYEQFGDSSRSAECFRWVLDSKNLEGQDFLIESHINRFWIRWQRALAHAQTSLDMLKAEAAMRLGQIYARNDMPDQAEQNFNLTIKLDPKNHVVKYDLSQILSVTGRKIEAIDFLTKSLSELPLNMQARDDLVMMLREVGRTDQADVLGKETALIKNAFPDNPP